MQLEKRLSAKVGGKKRNRMERQVFLFAKPPGALASRRHAFSDLEATRLRGLSRVWCADPTLDARRIGRDLMKRKHEESAYLLTLRRRAGELVARAGLENGEVKLAYKKLVAEFLHAGGPADDLIVKIGAQFFGCPLGKSRGPVGDSPLPGSKLLDFDYLEKFMVDCFMASA